jgi:hypothetical protein
MDNYGHPMLFSSSKMHNPSWNLPVQKNLGGSTNLPVGSMNPVSHAAVTELWASPEPMFTVRADSPHDNLGLYTGTLTASSP